MHHFLQTGGLEGKYRVAAPELMQDTFMSDSEDEGGEVECPIQQQQQYRYMNSEAGTLHRAKPLEDTVTDGHLWPSNNDRKVATIDRQPLDIGFLVSFVVDARGGAMKAKRRGGVRIIVPPAACAAPTRVTCRAATRRAPAAAPPPLMEGEALASRLLELQPQGAKFLAPVVIEVPIYTSSCREREIVVLRSDTGETWQDHYLHNNDNPLIQEALQRERQEYGGNETIGESGERVTRIITCDFPHYLACVSRVRQEVHVIGPEGGTISSAHIPQVQAQFPAAALTKRIRVGLQAQAASAAQCRRVLPRHAAVSPVLTVEPRRRKFHRSITLTAPLPALPDSTEKPSTSNLRLLCSIMGGQARAVWEDVTGSTPLTVTDDCASFTTTVSARFWMMNCQNVSDATKLATELYREMLLVPFDVRIVVLGKRLDALEGRLLVMTITDRYAYETLLQQEHYTEVAHSTSVRFLDGKDVYLEFSGNLVPVTKSGSQPMLTFEAFKDNRVEFTVRVKHHEENPSGRIYFMNEPKVPKGEQSQTPACVLDVELPERIAPRAGKSQVDYLNLDQSGFDALKDELSFHWGGDHNNSLGPGSLPYSHDRQVNGHDKIITNGDVKYQTKETDDSKDTKPQVNGGALHVDSNKTKATFDSDEDKTPMNTLEKGKKKPEGSVGFLGGLADKVKNVFSHSEDKEDEKETSPKPQPKPRESKERDSKERDPKEKDPKEKEKSPPKPAPRIISEDLLGKIDDVFKDLKTAPHQKGDDDISNQVYATKLVVDEENSKPIEDNLYEQYERMQPVDTPVCSQKTDPFQFYVGCCEGRYKKGQKHRHDETSNVVDRIEQVHFAAHEKLHDVSDKVHGDLAEGLCIIEDEKDKIKHKAGDAANDLLGDLEKAKSGAQDKLHELEDGARGKLTDIAESAEKVKDDVNAKAGDLKNNISSEVEDAKISATNLVDNVIHQAGVVKDDINSKAMMINFMAMERAEETKLREGEKLAQVGKAAEGAANNIKHKAQEGANAVSDAVHEAKDAISSKAQDVKSGAQDALDNAKASANEKLQSMGDSFEGVKEKSKKELKKEAKEAKKKAKEGKNFFTGLVHNIFGEKEKLEEEVKGKIAEGKESASQALDKAAAKKDELQDAVAKKQDELKEGAEQLAQSVEDKKKQVEKAAHDKKDEIEKSIQDKTSEAKQAVESKTGEIKASVEGKVDDVKGAIQDTAAAAQAKASETKDAIKNKANEVGDAIHETASEVGQAIHDKTAEAKDAVADKTKQVKDSIQETAADVGHAIQDKTVSFKESVVDEASKIGDAIHDKTSQAKEKANEVGHAINDEANKFGQTLQEKTSEAKDKANELGQAIQDKTAEAKDKANEFGQAIQDKTAEAKDKASEIGHSVQDGANKVGQAIQGKASEAKDKASEFGNAVHDTFTGFGSAVHDTASNVGNNIHDTASNVGHAIHDKTSDAKDAVYDKAGEISHEVHEKSHGFGEAIKDTFSGIGHAISETFSFGHDKADEAKDLAKEKASEIKSSVESTASELKDAAHDKASEASKAIHDKTAAVDSAIQSKTDEFGQAFHDSKDAAKNELDRIRQEAELTTEQISKSAEDAINAASNKKGEIQTSLGNKFDDIKQSGQEEWEYLQQSAADKASDLQRSSKQAFDHAKDSTLSTFDKVESSAKDKVSEAKDKWDEMQSSTRDTFASMRDDVHSLGSSAEDTLHSFQSSAGNTFDSLDDSAKLVLSDTQQHAEESSKQLFGDVKSSFEGFQVSADNKLEEIKGAGKEGVEAVGDRLGEVAEGVRGAEQAAAEAVAREADNFTSSLNNLGSSVFGSSGKGFMKDSSTKLLESEKSQSSPHKKSSGIPKLKRKK